MLLHRLTLPKFLLKEAHRALQRPGPYSHGLATSILQDAAEAFLRILGDERSLNVGPNQSFREVLGVVAKDMPAVTQYRAGLTQLNRARVMFKHDGLSTVQRNDVIVFAGNIEGFLTDICHTELNVGFATVSLADAIGHRRTQNWIRNAEDAFASGDLDSAVRHASGAMAIYLAHSNAHDSAFEDAGPLSPFVEMDLTSTAGRNPFDEGAAADLEWRGAVGEFARWTKACIDNIHDRVRLMARGVDVGAYDKLNVIAPRATMMTDGSIGFRDNRPTRTTPSKDDVRFCIDVVIDSALALRSNRPPAPPRRGAVATQLAVVRQADVIVHPGAEHRVEVIRTAQPGEILEQARLPRLPPDGDHVAVFQDSDPAYVPKRCVEAKSPPLGADPADTS